MDDAHAFHLIAQHWANRLTRDEALQLDAWLAQGPERSRRAREAMRIMDLSRELRAVDETAAAWERLRQQIRVQPRPASPLGRWAQDSVSRVGGGRARGRTRAALVGIAATIVAAAGVAAYRWHPAPPPADVLHAYTTGAGERREMELPDGSRVVLGPRTTLRVALPRFGEERTLRLDGIAHLEVASNPARPFTVVASGVATTAVGTAFTVRAYAGDSAVQVVVAEGRVLLHGAERPAATGSMLDAGELAQVDATGAIRIERAVDVDRYLSWMHGRPRYRLTPLGVVVGDLERWYDLVIALDDSALASVRVTTSFDPARPAADALDQLVRLLGAEYEMEGRHIRLFRRSASATADSDAKP